MAASITEPSRRKLLGAPVSEEVAMATEGGASTASSYPAGLAVAPRARGAAPAGIAIPSVGAMKAASAKAGSHKGKRSRLYSELLEEGRQSALAPNAPRMARAQVLEKARAAKAAK